MRIPNRHIMYKRYQDGEITEAEYKSYLAEQEEREKQATDRFNETIEKLNKGVNLHMKQYFEKVSLKQFIKDWIDTFGNNPKHIITEIYNNITLPRRKTRLSAGYDIASPLNFILKPNESIKFPTGLRCHMKEDNVLLVHVRSSVGFKYHTILSNVTGVVDADYVNADNEGHIFVKLVNHGDKDFVVKAGDGVVQAIFMKYDITDDDIAEGERVGGFGSTGK